MRSTRSLDHGVAAGVALGVVVGIGVCTAWFRPGRLLLLDWVIGPHADYLSRSTYGLDGGSVSGLPWHIAATGLSTVLGGPATWLPIAALFPVAAVGMGRLLAATGASPSAQLAAGAFYGVNPWVFDRIVVGHVGLLLGYALLPFVAKNFIAAQRGSWTDGIASGLWASLLIALSVHFVWIVLVMGIALTLRSRVRARTLLWAVAAGLTAAVCDLYVVVTSRLAGAQHALPGPADLTAYQTRGIDSWHAAGNIIGLYGFWRPTGFEPRDVVSSWWLVLLALMLLVVVGFVSHIGKGGDARRLALAVLVMGVASGLLAMGARGPTGGAYHFLYDHLAAFRVMREPQKFAMLVAFAYACGIGWAVDAIGGSLKRRQWAAATVAIASGLAYTPTIFGGVDGHLSLTRTPGGWLAADETTRGGHGSVLVLPWHQFLAFPATSRRVITNPAEAYLRRGVISGDNAELPGVPEEESSARSTYIENLIRQGPTVHNFGESAAALGAGYVLLWQTADAANYSWLRHQPDLRPVLSTPDASVWAIEAPIASKATLIHVTTTSYRVITSHPTVVTIPEPFDRGWQLDGHSGTRSPEGLTSFIAPAGISKIDYGPWRWIRRWDLVSLGSFGALLFLRLFVGARRRRRTQLPGAL